MLKLVIPIVKGNNSILVTPLTRGAAWGRRLLHNFGEMVLNEPIPKLVFF